MDKVKYILNSGKFDCISGNPIAYWASDNIISLYKKETQLSNYVITKQGLKSSDDKRFFRLWHEVNNSNINFCIKNHDDAIKSKKKWVPLNKGGSSKWYGDNCYVINWGNNGEEIKDYAKQLYRSVTRTITSMDYYYRKAISWPQITSSPNFRLVKEGYIFNAAGPSMFLDNEIFDYTLGFLNTNIVKNITSILNPTVNLCVTDMLNIPFIINDNKKNKVEIIVSNCYELSIKDYDSFETSWDFKKHPLL